MDERREWRKQYQKDYREEIDIMCKRIAVAAQRFMDGDVSDELTSDYRETPAKHKCWRCFWATWCGDRFFCPIYETCIKEPVHREVLDDPV